MGWKLLKRGFQPKSLSGVLSPELRTDPLLAFFPRNYEAMDAKDELIMGNNFASVKAVFLVIIVIVIAMCAYGKPILVQPLNGLTSVNGLTSAPAIPAEEWTASDQPYKDVEKQIATDYTDGKNMQLVLKRWQQLAARTPKGPVIQFAVIFASRGAYRVAKPDDMLPYSLVETLAKYDPGNVHEYTRFRFCMAEEAGKQLPLQNAEVIGKRLLQYNPKDTLLGST